MKTCHKGKLSNRNVGSKEQGAVTKIYAKFTSMPYACKEHIQVYVVSGYDKRSINLNKVAATFEKHIFFSQTDITRTGIISNSYNEMFEA